MIHIKNFIGSTVMQLSGKVKSCIPVGTAGIQEKASAPALLLPPAQALSLP